MGCEISGGPTFTPFEMRRRVDW